MSVFLGFFGASEPKIFHRARLSLLPIRKLVSDRGECSVKAIFIML